MTTTSPAGGIGCGEFLKGCGLCRFSGNSMDARATKGTIYCQQSGGMVKKHRKGIVCLFGLPFDLTPCMGKALSPPNGEEESRRTRKNKQEKGVSEG